MNLTPDEGKLFYELDPALLSFVNRTLNVVIEQFSDSGNTQRHKGEGGGGKKHSRPGPPFGMLCTTTGN